MPFCYNRHLSHSIRFLNGLSKRGLRSMPKTLFLPINRFVLGQISGIIRGFSGGGKDTIPIYFTS